MNWYGILYKICYRFFINWLFVGFSILVVIMVVIRVYLSSIVGLLVWKVLVVGVFGFKFNFLIV